MSKLQERIKQYKIPRPPYLPASKNVMVFRLPSETVTAGGIVIPGEAEEPKPMGVLLAAGLVAYDIMKSNLIEIGDVVWFGRYAGWEKEITRDPAGLGKTIIQLKIEDVLGSVDALDRVDHYELRENDKSQHVYVAKSARKAA